MTWRRVALKDIGQIIGGGTPKTSISENFGDDYPWITPKDLSQQKSRYVLRGERGISAQGLSSSSAKLLPKGTVLLSSRAPIGLTAIAAQPVTTNQGCRSFVPGPEVDTLFMYYLLGSMTEEFKRNANGSTFKEISGSTLASIEVSIPSLREQRAIAATLGALDDKIESNRRAISIIDELVRARFEADFDLAQADDGVSVSDLVLINRKQKLSRGTKATYVGMSSLTEFAPEIFEWEIREFGSGQKFVNGDVLMARITPCLENGKTAIVDMLEDGEVGWGSTEYVVLSPKGLITTPWIYALARHELVREWAIRRMTGTSGRQRFQAAGFSDYRIAEPDQKRLEEFNSFAVPLFNRITQLRNETKRLTSLRDTLLPELLSGRVSMPVGEVAS